VRNGSDTYLVYNATEGVGSDLGQAVGDNLNRSNSNAATLTLIKLLAKTDGRLTIFAHSQGGAIAVNAALMATSDDKKNIKMFLYGGFQNPDATQEAKNDGIKITQFRHKGDLVPHSGSGKAAATMTEIQQYGFQFQGILGFHNYHGQFGCINPEQCKGGLVIESGAKYEIHKPDVDTWSYDP
jgi:hypothetical protein